VLNDLSSPRLAVESEVDAIDTRSRELSRRLGAAQVARCESDRLKAIPVVVEASVSVAGPVEDLWVRIACTVTGGVVPEAVSCLLEDEIPRHVGRAVNARVQGCEVRVALAAQDGAGRGGTASSSVVAGRGAVR